jgi:hypothetical protein
MSCYYILLPRYERYHKYKEEAPAVPRVHDSRVDQSSQLGGWARGQYGAEQRSEWARQSGIACRLRHGKAFFQQSGSAQRLSQAYETRKTIERRRLEAAHQAKTAPNRAIAELMESAG